MKAISSFFRRIHKQLKLWWDYRAFQAKYSWLQETRSAEEKGDVLMVSLSYSLPTVLLQGIFLKRMQLMGYKPVVLTNREYVWARKYFRVCGVQTFIFFDDMQAQERANIPQQEAENILQKHSTFASFYDLAWEGSAIGKHILSTIVRRLVKGTITFDDPEVTALLKTLVPESLATVRAAKRLFDSVRPKAVIFLEKGYLPFGIIFDEAVKCGLNTIQFHHAHRTDLINMKRFRKGNTTQHPFSVSQATWEKVKATPWSAAEEQAFMDELEKSYRDGSWFNRKFLLADKRVKAPEEVKKQLGIDNGKKTAVIFSHVLWDATFFFGENLFKDYEEWLIATVRAAIENDKVNWLIKLHPDYVWKMKSMGDTRPPRDIIALQMNIGTLPAHVQVVPPETDISTYSFFAITDYCITVRGTIGIEAPCFGIPVFTAGTGRYSGLGFTHDSKTADEYLGILARIQEFPRLSAHETQLARKHAHALFMLRPLSIKTVEMVPKPGTNYGQETIIRATSIADIQNASDLTTFADWVLHSTDEDYLASR